MDSIEPNQSSNTLDLTSSPLLPAAQRWSHDPETSKWFLHERSNRLLHDGFKARITFQTALNRIQTDFQIEPGSRYPYDPLPHCKG